MLIDAQMSNVNWGLEIWNFNNSKQKFAISHSLRKVVTPTFCYTLKRGVSWLVWKHIQNQISSEFLNMRKGTALNWFFDFREYIVIKGPFGREGYNFVYL